VCDERLYLVGDVAIATAKVPNGSAEDVGMGVVELSRPFEVLDGEYGTGDLVVGPTKLGDEDPTLCRRWRERESGRCARGNRGGCCR
jgi:hypothetical protein